MVPQKKASINPKAANKYSLLIWFPKLEYIREYTGNTTKYITVQGASPQVRITRRLNTKVLKYEVFLENVTPYKRTVKLSNSKYKNPEPIVYITYIMEASKAINVISLAFI